MEYNLLKSIEPNCGIRVPNEKFPNLTPFPAADYINPGLGQISRLYSFYVPLYSRKNLHTLQKQAPNTNAESLEGFGSAEEKTEVKNDVKEDIVDSSEKDEIESQLQSNPLEFNANKRKKLGDGIHESFLYPKIIKTDKLFLPSNNTKRDKKETTFERKTNKSDKPVKHKFAII